MTAPVGKEKRNFALEEWEVQPLEADKHYIRIRGTFPGKRFKIANVLIPEYKYPTPEIERREIQESIANANLIANSGKLLAALECLLDEMGFGRIIAHTAASLNAFAVIEEARKDFI